MAATTTISSLPYPEGSDANNVPSDMADLADALDGTIVKKLTTAGIAGLAAGEKPAGTYFHNTTTSKLMVSNGSDVLEPYGLWAAYEVAWTGGSPAIEDGELKGRWCRIGTTVHVKVSLLIGSSTNKGSTTWAFSLPVARTTEMGTPTGTAWMQDATGATTTIIGQAAATTATTMVCWYQTAGALAIASVGPTLPFGTWATGDILQMNLTYEAA